MSATVVEDANICTEIKACKHGFRVLLNCMPKCDSSKWLLEQEARFNAWAVGFGAIDEDNINCKLRHLPIHRQLMTQLLKSLRATLSAYKSRFPPCESLGAEDDSLAFSDQSHVKYGASYEKYFLSVHTRAPSGFDFMTEGNKTKGLLKTCNDLENCVIRLWDLQSTPAEIFHTVDEVDRNAFRPVDGSGRDMSQAFDSYLDAVLERDLKDSRLPEEVQHRIYSSISETWHLLLYQQHRRRTAQDNKETYSPTKMDSPMTLRKDEISAQAHCEERCSRGSMEGFNAIDHERVVVSPTHSLRSEACSSNQTGITSALEGASLDIPEPPSIASGAKLFECPYCCTLCPVEVTIGEAWKCHIIEDIAPYVCLLTGCNNPSLKYRCLSEWIRHMQNEHMPMEWRCSHPHFSQTEFESVEAYKHHFNGEHQADVTKVELESLAELNCKRKEEIFSACPFCDSPFVIFNKLFGSTMSQVRLLRHIGRHLESLALSGLPWDIAELADSTASRVPQGRPESQIFRLTDQGDKILHKYVGETGDQAISSLITPFTSSGQEHFQYSDVPMLISEAHTSEAPEWFWSGETLVTDREQEWGLVLDMMSPRSLAHLQKIVASKESDIEQVTASNTISLGEQQFGDASLTCNLLPQSRWGFMKGEAGMQGGLTGVLLFKLDLHQIPSCRLTDFEVRVAFRGFELKGGYGHETPPIAKRIEPTSQAALKGGSLVCVSAMVHDRSYDLEATLAVWKFKVDAECDPSAVTPVVLGVVIRHYGEPFQIEVEMAGTMASRWQMWRKLMPQATHRGITRIEPCRSGQSIDSLAADLGKIVRRSNSLGVDIRDWWKDKMLAKLLRGH